MDTVYKITIINNDTSEIKDFELIKNSDFHINTVKGYNSESHVVSESIMLNENIDLFSLTDGDNSDLSIILNYIADTLNNNQICSIMISVGLVENEKEFYSTPVLVNGYVHDAFLTRNIESIANRSNINLNITISSNAPSFPSDEDSGVI